ncbi:TetR/AcrR family transcriptional regulator [Nitratireductor alexandrii]|uniref:TetR/AcrR family transcriptional regulator n=1 Tax=Nitratireductor alexandrii TaxID=2448161 RepID=UPI000FD758E0|nr:TetR/AcrR family transcriptional regulator [Nitratireductor alexandrii]
MAGRPRSIDRDTVLDAAEALVTRSGAGALSFDAVAKEAGVTKSGVQYCFGTRDNLIRSMVERWGRSFEHDVMARAGGDTSPRSVIRAHLEATRDSDDAEYSRSAVMMIAQLQHPDQVAATRKWYTDRLSPLDMADPADREAALALLAGEGAFMLRAFGLVDLDEAKWDALFTQLLSKIEEHDTDQSGGA